MKTPQLPCPPEIPVPEWAKELPFAITVCDKNGIITYMNDKSVLPFGNDGGQELVGKSLFDCHSEHSKEIIHELLLTGRSNIYTIEKNGARKLICQSPWFKKGRIAGLVEISIPLPENMPHFIRQ